MAPRRNPRALLLVPIVAFAAILAMTAPASAGTRAVRASAIDGEYLVFKLRGVSRSAKVGSARLRIGRYQRKVSVRLVRRGMKRGVLRVRLPRAVRLRLRRAAAKRRAALRRPAQRPSSSPTGKSPKAPSRQETRKEAQKAALVVTIDDKKEPINPIDPPGENCSIPAGARYVSPSGSDSNPGTSDRPWRTLDEAESQATPGMTVVLRGGTYGASGHVTYIERNGTASAPITWVAAPGETPVVQGQLAIDGNHRRACGLALRGGTGSMTPSHAEGENVKVYVTGDDVELANSEVTGSRWHAGVFVQEAENFRLVGNHIHHNGRFGDASHANLDHGIYVGSGSGTIERNRIENNVARGVQLYPDARNVTVRGNRITGNGRAGVQLSANASGNVIVGNDIWGNQTGIRTYDLAGSGNVARDNRLWDNSEGNLVEPGPLSLSGNQLL